MPHHRNNIGSCFHQDEISCESCGEVFVCSEISTLFQIHGDVNCYEFCTMEGGAGRGDHDRNDEGDQTGVVVEQRSWVNSKP